MSQSNVFLLFLVLFVYLFVFRLWLGNGSIYISISCSSMGIHIQISSTHGEKRQACTCNPSAGGQRWDDPRNSLASNSHGKMTGQASGSVRDSVSSKQGQEWQSRTPAVLCQMFAEVCIPIQTHAHTLTHRKEVMDSNSICLLPPPPE